MGKRVWIVNYYTTPPEYVSNSRHLEFARYLSECGYDVTIFCSGFLQGGQIDFVPAGKKFVRKKYNADNFVHVKVKHYEGNGIKRMFSIFQFAWRIFYYRKHFEKPDIILHNIHAPFDFPITWCAKKLGARYIAEAWDLWPYYFVAFGLIHPKNPVMKFAYAIERKMYEKADQIIFTFEGGADYLKNHCWTKELGGKIDTSKVHYINNGVNLKEFAENGISYQLNDPDLSDKNSFKIIYVGSICLVNNVKQLIDAAKLLKKNLKYKFLIYGNGSDKTYLQEYCKQNGITNVIFKADWVPLCYVPYIVSRASLNVMNYQKIFGEHGVSSGKLFQYLAAGKPILCNIQLNYDIIEGNHLGIARDLDTPEKYADAIETIGNLSSMEYDDMCERVLNVAKEFDYKVLCDKLMGVLNTL